MSELERTCLHAFHIRQGAKMVDFAGYEMPVQYPAGIMTEHLQCREGAGLFDVSHMGQLILSGADAQRRARALETLVPADVLGLEPGRQRYALFTNAAGGIEDDLMIANRDTDHFLVVNAARKDHDIALLRAGLPDNLTLTVVEDRGLLALQGPKAEAVLAAHVPVVRDMRFMDVITAQSAFGTLWISRSGYTGEDGYEISVAADQAEALAEALVADDACQPIGLGARDSLRLEAGLCLYGADIDTTTTPVEAALTWAIGKARKPGGARAGGYPGADIVARQLAEGAPRRRIGFQPEGRAPMRGGTEVYLAGGENPVGTITSGGFGPSVGGPVAMGYIETAHAKDDSPLEGDLRGKRHGLNRAALPFVTPGFKR